MESRSLVVRYLWAVALSLCVGWTSAQAQPPAPPGEDSLGSFLAQGEANDAKVAVSAQFSAPAKDQVGQLTVTATIKPGWHIYSITQAAGGPVATKITIVSDARFRVGPFEALTPPEKHREKLFDDLLVESHQGTVSWQAPLELAAGVDPAALRITGKLLAQPCDAGSCMPPRDFPFTAALAADAQSAVRPASLTPSVSPTPKIEPAVVSAPPPSVVSPPTSPPISVARAMLLGFLGGLILNLMPCVLPVIGLKVLSFLEQSGQNRWQALVLNAWYSLGILAVFLLLAVLSVAVGLGWGQLFSFRGFNITLAAVVFAMALSFLGVWEIPIPGFVGRGKTAELGQKEGAVGALAKGVLTTILATPCSAPFLGTALAWTVNQPAANTLAVFASAGLGMASPYLLIGAFPGLMRFLPKPGAWMDTFKQVMGFVLLGTVVFLLSFMPFPAVVPTVALMFGLWGACWWIGRCDPTAEPAIYARTWCEAIAFAGIVWLVVFPGLGFVLPEKYAFSLSAYMEERFAEVAQKPREPLRQRIEQLVSAKRAVLVDFTADWCLTCKTLEKVVLQSDAVQKTIQDNRVAVLKGDWTSGAADVTEMLDLLGSKQVPVIAVYTPGDFKNPTVMRGAYTQQELLDALNKAGPTQQ